MTEDNQSLLSALLAELNALSEDEKLVLLDTLIDSAEAQKKWLPPNNQEKISTSFLLNDEQEIDHGQ